MNQSQSRRNISGHYLLLAAFVTLLSAAAIYSSEAKALGNIYEVTASKLNVRTGPSTNYRKLSRVWRGARVKVIKHSGNWRYIITSSGRNAGWVSGRYLVPVGLAGAHSNSVRQALGSSARKQ